MKAYLASLVCHFQFNAFFFFKDVKHAIQTLSTLSFTCSVLYEIKHICLNSLLRVGRTLNRIYFEIGVV